MVNSRSPFLTRWPSWKWICSRKPCDPGHQLHRGDRRGGAGELDIVGHRAHLRCRHRHRRRRRRHIGVALLVLAGRRAASRRRCQRVRSRAMAAARHGSGSAELGRARHRDRRHLDLIGQQPAPVGPLGHRLHGLRRQERLALADLPAAAQGTVGGDQVGRDRPGGHGQLVLLLQELLLGHQHGGEVGDAAAGTAANARSSERCAARTASLRNFALSCCLRKPTSPFSTSLLRHAARCSGSW